MDKVIGVEPAQPAAAPHADYPKWIVPHGSHVDEQGRALAFTEFHKGRDGVTTVLVTSKNEEEIALAPAGRPDEESSDEEKDTTRAPQPEEEKETI